MAETFSPTASLKSTSSHVSVAESPNEYRNLLISISGDKSDHVRWLECLKTFNWRGDGNFEFSLDKCGVPALKNGDYRLNLADECIQMALSKSDKTVMEYKFFWEGNFFDKKVEDAYELTMESMAVVVNKCVQVLRSHGVTKGKPVVLYAPNVLQLPVVLYACAKIGAVLTYVNATINREVGDLVQLFRLSSADLIITVDGFFMGEELQSTKKLVDEVVEKLEEESSQIREILVVRHTGANPAVPPPTESLPRRPFYGLEVPFTEGRDFHWSDLIIDAAIEAEVEWLTAEDILFNTIQKR
jgi:acyl-coenzyme A synthetase/AMP-(fatty) acid ligase